MIKFVIFLVLLELLKIKGTFDPFKINYCKLTCQDKSIENTACECYIKEGIVEFTDDIVEFRTQMVNKHNELRNRVGTGTEKQTKGAANMNALSYDLELEYMARCHANKDLQTQTCRRTSKFENPGQTIEGSKEKLNISEIMSTMVEWFWYTGRLKYLLNNNYTINPYNYSTRIAREVGPLIELLWWSQTHVGCARTFKTTNNRWPTIFPFEVVCIYGGTGPSAVRNMNVYEEGKGCSKCPTNITCNSKYSRLCGEISPIPTDEPIPMSKGTFEPSKIDYCKLRCHGTSSLENAACECYKREYIVEVMDDIVEFRTQMLNKHNELRNRVGTGTENQTKRAANMNALSYDLELEYMARCHGSKPFAYHDCLRTSKFKDTGEITARYFKILNISEITALVVEKFWYKFKLRRLRGYNINPYNYSTEILESVKPLIELLWSSQTHVGCVRIFHRTENIKFSTNPFRIVCCYGGTGPSAVYNMNVYEEGEGCSKCPTNITCNSKYSGLCGEIAPIPTNKPPPLSEEKEVIHTWSDIDITSSDTYVTYDSSSDVSATGEAMRIRTRNEIFFFALSIILLLLY